MRGGNKCDDAKLIDVMMCDGLTDVFSKEMMGITAENIASQFGIDRAAQDNLALASQLKAYKATQAGKFINEIVPIEIEKRKEEHLEAIPKPQFLLRTTLCPSGCFAQTQNIFQIYVVLAHCQPIKLLVLATKAGSGMTSNNKSTIVHFPLKRLIRFWMAFRWEDPRGNSCRDR